MSHTGSLSDIRSDRSQAGCGTVGPRHIDAGRPDTRPRLRDTRTENKSQKTTGRRRCREPQAAVAAIPTDATGPVWTGVIAVAADDLPLAPVGSHRVDAVERGAAGLPLGATFINVCPSARGGERGRRRGEGGGVCVWGRRGGGR